MSIPEHARYERPAARKWLAWCLAIVLLGLLAVGALLFFPEYRAGLLGAVLYLPLLLCLLIHFVMHGKHRGHGRHDA